LSPAAKKVGAHLLGNPPQDAEGPDGGFNFPYAAGDAAPRSLLPYGEVGAHLLGNPPQDAEGPDGGFNFPATTKEGPGETDDPPNPSRPPPPPTESAPPRPKKNPGTAANCWSITKPAGGGGPFGKDGKAPGGTS